MLTRDGILHDLKTHLEKSINNMKHTADAKFRDVNFAVGDWVYLHLQPYHQHPVFGRMAQKLATRYYGPFFFEVEAKIRPVAYHLKYPVGTRIHPVFHVSFLKKRVGSDTLIAGALPPLRNNGVLRLPPERILERRPLQEYN